MRTRASFTLAAPSGGGVVDCGVGTVIFPAASAPAQPVHPWAAEVRIRLPEWGIARADQLRYRAALSPGGVQVRSAAALISLGVLPSGSHSVEMGVLDGAVPISLLWRSEVAVTVLAPRAGSPDPVERAAALGVALAAPGAAPRPAAVRGAVLALREALPAATAPDLLAQNAAALDALSTGAAASGMSTADMAVLRGHLRALGEAALAAGAQVRVQGRSVHLVSGAAESMRRRPSALGAQSDGAVVIQLPGGVATVALSSALGSAMVAVTAALGIFPDEPSSGAADRGVGSAVTVHIFPASGSRNGTEAAAIRAAIPTWALAPFPCDLRQREWDPAADDWGSPLGLRPSQLPASALVGFTALQGGEELGVVTGGDWQRFDIRTPSGNVSVPRAAVRLAYPQPAANPWCAEGEGGAGGGGEVQLDGGDLATVRAFVASEVMPATNLGDLADPDFSSAYSEFRPEPVLLVGGTLALFWILLLGGYVYDLRQDAELAEVFEEAQAGRSAAADKQKQERKADLQTARGWDISPQPELHSLEQAAGISTPERLETGDEGPIRSPPARSTVAVVSCSRSRSSQALCIAADPATDIFRQESGLQLVAVNSPNSETSLSRVCIAPGGTPGQSVSSTTPAGDEESPPLFDAGPLRRSTSHPLLRGSALPLRKRKLTLVLDARQDTDGTEGGVVLSPTSGPHAVKSPREAPAALPASAATAGGALRQRRERRGQLTFLHPPPLDSFRREGSRDTQPAQARRPVPLPSFQSAVSVLDANGPPMSPLSGGQRPRRMGSSGLRRGRNFRRPRIVSPRLAAGTSDSPLVLGIAGRGPQRGAVYCSEREADRAATRATAVTFAAVQDEGTATASQEPPRPCLERYCGTGNELAAALKAHTWLTPLFRTAGNGYTRPQRVTVLFSFILTCFFILVVFAGRESENASVLRGIAAACLTSLLLMPVVVVLQTIFQRAKRRPPVAWYRRERPDPYQGQPILGMLTVRVLEASDLPNLDYNDADLQDVSDPYVRVDVEDKSWKTVTVWNDLDPVYDGRQVVSFPVRDTEKGGVTLTVMDDDGAQEDSVSDVIGTVTVTMGYIMEHLARGDVGASAVIDEWLQVTGPAVDEQGCRSAIRVIIEYTHYAQPVWECERDRLQHEAKKRNVILGEDVVSKYEPGPREEALERVRFTAEPGSAPFSPKPGEASRVPAAGPPPAVLKLEAGEGLHIIVCSAALGPGGPVATCVELVRKGKQPATGRTSVRKCEQRAPVYAERFVFPLTGAARRFSQRISFLNFVRRLSGGGDTTDFIVTLIDKGALLESAAGTAVLAVDLSECEGKWAAYRVRLRPRDDLLSAFAAPDAGVGEVMVWVQANRPAPRRQDAEGDRCASWLGIDLRLVQDEAATSAKFSLFILIVLAGVTSGAGWWKTPHVYFVAGLAACLCTATFLLLLKKAFRLLLFCVGMYGCAVLFATGKTAIGVAVCYFWAMVWIAAGVREADPDLVPFVLGLYWAGNMAIVLTLYYGVHWALGAAMGAAQLLSTGLFWFCAQVAEAGHLAAAGFILVWAAHLAALTHNLERLPAHGNGAAAGSAERTVVPVCFAALGLVCVMRSAQAQRGELIPQELPFYWTWVGYALAAVIQLVTAGVVLTSAMQWTAASRDVFLRAAAVACVQDFFLNEPIKLLLFPALKAVAKALSKSMVGSAVRKLAASLGIDSMADGAFAA